MKHILLFITILVSVSLIIPQTSFAKVLPQAKGKKVTGKAIGGVAGISVYPKLRGDRRALSVSFGNLQNANSVQYALIYVTNGQEEGAGGSVDTKISTSSRELLFGTCSKNDCRYHSNITNARLEVTSKLKSGKTSVKRYKIRI